jgi:hypothetical protein
MAYVTFEPWLRVRQLQDGINRPFASWSTNDSSGATAEWASNDSFRPKPPVLQVPGERLIANSENLATVLVEALPGG